MCVVLSKYNVENIYRFLELINILFGKVMISAIQRFLRNLWQSFIVSFFKYSSSVINIKTKIL